MLRSIIGAQDESFAHDPAGRGYCVMYRENQVNHCPGCGRTHWYVGRISAECGFCSTALPLAEATVGAGTHIRNQRPIFLAAGRA
jgi:hypothetical protein